jgi:hypothetical protein
MSSGAFSILATATSPCTSKTSGETSTDVSSPTQVSLSTRTYFFLLSIPFTKIWYVRWHLRLKMSTIFFRRRKASSGGWKSLFLNGSPKTRGETWKIHETHDDNPFQWFSVKERSYWDGAKKALPCLRDNHEALKIQDEQKGNL